VVITEITSPGVTSCSGGFFRVGTGGGAPSASVAEGVGVGFGRAAAVLGFCCVLFWALEVKENRRKAAMLNSSTFRIEERLLLIASLMLYTLRL
jgi:hypothetical protein